MRVSPVQRWLAISPASAETLSTGPTMLHCPQLPAVPAHDVTPTVMVPSVTTVAS